MYSYKSEVHGDGHWEGDGHFLSGLPELPLTPVVCNKSVTFLGNWNQMIGDILDGKQHSGPKCKKFKPPIMFDLKRITYL